MEDNQICIYEKPNVVVWAGYKGFMPMYTSFLTDGCTLEVINPHPACLVYSQTLEGEPLG